MEFIEHINKKLREYELDEITEDNVNLSMLETLKNRNVYPTAYAMQMHKKLELEKKNRNIEGYNKILNKLIIEHVSKEIKCSHIVKDEEGNLKCTECYQKSGIPDVDSSINL